MGVVVRAPWIRLVVFPLMFLVACASAPAPCPTLYPANTPSRVFLWQVTGSHGSLILLGTHQAAGKDDVPAEALRYLDTAEVFVAEAREADESYDQDPGWRRALALPPGRSLMNELPADDFEDLVDRLGASSGAVAKMRPWVALGQLIKTVLAFPTPNMAQALAERAEARHLAMEYLDSWSLQMAFLDMVVSVDDLRGALHDYRNLRCSMTNEVASYRVGASTLIAREKALPATDADDAKTIAIDKRTDVWSAKLRTYLDTGRRAFVAIGVSNIVGPHGIAQRLARAGYTVTRLWSVPRGRARYGIW